MTDSLYEIGRQTVADAELILRGLPPLSCRRAQRETVARSAVEADRAQLSRRSPLDIERRARRSLERYRQAGEELGSIPRRRRERTIDGGRAPTIRDVALRAGVSVATASNVVNGNRPVGEASRRKVVEAIAALGYRVDRAASALRGTVDPPRRHGRSRHHQRLLRQPRARRRSARRSATATISSSSRRARTPRTSGAASRRWSRAASTA